MIYTVYVYIYIFNNIIYDICIYIYISYRLYDIPVVCGQARAEVLRVW